MTLSAPVQLPPYVPVRTLMVHLTYACNLRCDYCFVVKEPRHMSLETARRTVEWFMSRPVSGAEYVLSLNCFGGEPFVAMDVMEEVIRLGRARRPNTYKRVEFSATTNGTVAGPRVERIVRDADMALLISLDGGPGASAHRPFASGRESLSRVLRNLPDLVRWARLAIVRTTFHPEALDLVGSVRFCLEAGAPSVALCPVVEASWEGREAALEAAYQALADWFIQEARGGRLLPLEVTRQLLDQLHFARRGGGRPARPCPVGGELLGVDPDGNVMPCHRFLYRRGDWLGTVADPELPPARRPYLELSSRDIPGCDGCVAEPVCGGGCRVLALAAGRGLHGRHPGHCLTMRAHARAATRIYDTLTAERNPAFLRMLGAPRMLTGALAELVAR